MSRKEVLLGCRGSEPNVSTAGSSRLGLCTPAAVSPFDCGLLPGRPNENLQRLGPQSLVPTVGHKKSRSLSVPPLVRCKTPRGFSRSSRGIRASGECVVPHRWPSVGSHSQELCGGSLLAPLVQNAMLSAGARGIHSGSWGPQRTPVVCYLLELEVLLYAGISVLGLLPHRNWCFLNKSGFDYRVSNPKL